MLIGLIVVAFMLYQEFDVEAISIIEFTRYSVLWLLVSLIMMAVRDIGYMIRLRVLSDKSLNWRKTFNIIMLWEFTSAVTPSAIGGTSIAVLYINKEGLSVGRSTAVVLTTSFLDEIYFLIMFPLLFLVVQISELFSIGEVGAEVISFTNEFFYFAVVGYSLKLVYTIFLSYGLFVNPRAIKWLLLQVFRLPFLRKWRQQANQAGSDIIVTSKELRTKSISFWVKAFFASFLSWTSRFWVVNSLLLAFFVVNDHFLIFARQLVMWIMMLVSPTPGGSGFAEFVFSRYLADFIPLGFAVSMALLWRLTTYYPYLFIGAFILPRWIKSKFSKKKE
jgi:hypothetical protein